MHCVSVYKTARLQRIETLEASNLRTSNLLPFPGKARLIKIDGVLAMISNGMEALLYLKVHEL